MDDSRLIGLPAPGELVAGKYRIERLIGLGGMGAVFLAQHELLDERVALKLMLAEAMNDGAAATRLVNEARAAAKIRGAHVARVSDVGILEDGRPYIAMELLEGDDLGSLLQKVGFVAPSTAVDYLLEGMEAIAQAHARGVVHRDLKPSNFFLAKQLDGSAIVKVLDFGIAKTIGAGASVALTNTKAMMGSPLYMSPEQIRRAKDVDPQSDVWSLGVVAFELLTGKTPFLGENVGELVLAIAEQTPPLAHAVKAGIPPELSAAIARCLEKERAQRYKTVVELARALRPFASPAGAIQVERVAAAFEFAGARSTGSGGAATEDTVRAIPTTGDAFVPPSIGDAATVAGASARVSVRTQGAWTNPGASTAAALAAQGRRRFVFRTIGGGVALGLIAAIAWAAHVSATSVASVGPPTGSTESTAVAAPAPPRPVETSSAPIPSASASVTARAGQPAAPMPGSGGVGKAPAAAPPLPTSTQRKPTGRPKGPVPTGAPGPTSGSNVSSDGLMKNNPF